MNQFLAIVFLALWAFCAYSVYDTFHHGFTGFIGAVCAGLIMAAVTFLLLGIVLVLGSFALGGS